MISNNGVSFYLHNYIVGILSFGLGAGVVVTVVLQAALGVAAFVGHPEVAAARVENHVEFLHGTAEANFSEVLRPSEGLEHHSGFLFSSR